MTKNSLAFMLILVCVMGLGAYLLKDKSEPVAAPENPLAAVDFGSIKELKCKTAAHGSWKIERRRLNNLFSSESVAGGAKVEVNEDLYGRVLGFLQDAR